MGFGHDFPNFPGDPPRIIPTPPVQFQHVPQRRVAANSEWLEVIGSGLWFVLQLLGVLAVMAAPLILAGLIVGAVGNFLNGR